jgi:hypothetical protein
MNLVVNGLRLTGRRYGVGRYLEYVLRGWQDIPHPFDRILVCVPGKPDGVALTLPASRTVIVGEDWGTYWEQVIPAQRQNGDLLFLSELWSPPVASRTVLTHHGSAKQCRMRFRCPWRAQPPDIPAEREKADAVITVWSRPKRHCQVWRCQPAKIRVIPNGVDAAFAGS